MNNQYNLTKEQIQGFPLELFLGLLLTSSYKKTENFLPKYHRTVGEYIDKQSKESDNIVYYNEMKFLEGEAKNWSQQNKPYGRNTIYEKVLLNRLIHSNALIKILFISFLSLISKKGLALLKAHGVHVFEVGKVVTHADLPRKGRNNKFFYSTKHRFQMFINNIIKNLGEKARRFFASVKSITLDNYLYNNTQYNSFNNNNNTDIGLSSKTKTEIKIVSKATNNCFNRKKAKMKPQFSNFSVRGQFYRK